MEKPSSDGIDAYIVIEPCFMLFCGYIVEQIAKLAQHGNAQIIFPLSTFRVSHNEALYPFKTVDKFIERSRTDKFVDLNLGLVSLDRLRHIIRECGELPQGQPVVRSQQADEGVFDDRDVKSLLDTDYGDSLAFLIYARKHYKKKLIYLSLRHFWDFRKHKVWPSNKRSPFTKRDVIVCDDVRKWNPFYVFDLVNGRRRRTSLPWPYIQGTFELCGLHTIITLVQYYISGKPCTNYQPDRDDPARGHYDWATQKMLEHRDIFQPMLGKPLFDSLGPKTKGHGGKYFASLLRALSNNDERYQFLIHELETLGSHSPSYKLRASYEELIRATCLEDFAQVSDSKFGSRKLPHSFVQDVPAAKRHQTLSNHSRISPQDESPAESVYLPSPATSHRKLQMNHGL